MSVNLATCFFSGLVELTLLYVGYRSYMIKISHVNLFLSGLGYVDFVSDVFQACITKS